MTSNLLYTLFMEGFEKKMEFFLKIIIPKVFLDHLSFGGCI